MRPSEAPQEEEKVPRSRCSTSLEELGKWEQFGQRKASAVGHTGSAGTSVVQADTTCWGAEARFPSRAGAFWSLQVATR